MSYARRTVLSSGLAAAFGLAGCSELTDEPTAEATPVETDTVIMPDEWVYEPAVVEIPKGTTVTWENDGSHKHTVTFRDDEPVDLDAELKPGGSLTYTFEEPGTFDYYCRYHQPDMVGTVIVTD